MLQTPVWGSFGVVADEGLSCLHMPVHVIAVGDAHCDWFKCNLIKLSKVQRER